MPGPLAPLEDRIVIKPVTAPDKTTFGLWLSPGAQEAPREGVVYAVGPGRYNYEHGRLDPLDIAVGDIVIYTHYAGFRWFEDALLETGEYIILESRDVLAIADAPWAGPADDYVF